MAIHNLHGLIHPMITSIVQMSVAIEREKQDIEWGEQNLAIHEFMSILGEEVGEAFIQANKYYWSEQPMDKRKHWTLLLGELVQVSAVSNLILEYMVRVNNE